MIERSIETTICPLRHVRILDECGGALVACVTRQREERRVVMKKREVARHLDLWNRPNGFGADESAI
jgi:hypothetical protein